MGDIVIELMSEVVFPVIELLSVETLDALTPELVEARDAGHRRDESRGPPARQGTKAPF